ncbi:MAG TPA: hypothetical protein VFE78_10810 [Gemmataceae bacterium]|jgi:hypothetical protein|nr:hypothetical protein [Gemmataceae bacterium]
MSPRFALALLLSVAPAAAVRAEDAPERLLPAGTQLYVRWDGIDAHRAAYAQTGVGKMMSGDTGAFAQSLFRQLQDGLGALLTVDQLLGGVPPDKLQALQNDAAEATKVLSLLGQNGFILGAEVRGVLIPGGQVTLIIPNAGAKPEAALGAMRLITNLAKAPVKRRKVEGRDVQFLVLGIATLAWWAEGQHFVLSLATEPADAMVKGMSAPKGPRLTDNPLFKRLQAMKKFETSSRGFLDVASLSKLAATVHKDVPKLLDDLGINGVQSLALWSGFDGAAERVLVEMDAPGPRKGLLTLLSGKPFRLGDVPALPPDVVSWSMTNLDVGAAWDVVLKGYEDVLRLASPKDVDELKAGLQKMNETLGFDLRKDLLGALGDRFVMYNTPSDGPLSLGSTLLFQVRDAEKLQASLDQLARSLGKLAGVEVRIKKRAYSDVTLHSVHIRQQGFFFVPSYAVHNGWLAVAFYPQPVQGFVRRSKGEMATWRPSAQVKASFEKLPQQFISVSYSDPRPSLRQVFSLAPLIAASVESFNPDLGFDVGSLPNTQEALRHLFPNVSVVTDDGKTVRLEDRGSLILPIELTGIDTYTVIVLFSLARLMG